MKFIAPVLLLTLMATCTIAQTDTTHEHQGPPAPVASEHHKDLQAKEVGTWDGEMTMWMAPNTEPMVMPVVETNTMMEGGMWVLSEFESGPYKGIGQFGYDPIKNEHIGTWIDNMSPHLGVMRGKMNDKDELVMYSTGYNPHTNEAEEMKSVLKYVSDDEKDFVMYKKPKGGDEWTKSFEVKYKRRKTEQG